MNKTGNRKLGTFLGVYTPTILTILGVIMYLRIGWLTGPGVLFFVGLVVSPLVAPVVALEKLGVMDSIRRAWDLARSRFWWLIGYAFVLTLLGQLIVTGPVYLVSNVVRP